MAPRRCQTNLPECVSGDLASAPVWDCFYNDFMLNVDVFHTRHLNHDNFRRYLQAMATNTTRTVAMLSESGWGNPKILGAPQHSAGL